MGFFFVSMLTLELSRQWIKIRLRSEFFLALWEACTLESADCFWRMLRGIAAAISPTRERIHFPPLVAALAAIRPPAKTLKFCLNAERNRILIA